MNEKNCMAGDIKKISLPELKHELPLVYSFLFIRFCFLQGEAYQILSSFQ